MPNHEVEFTFCPRRTKRKRTSNVMCYFIIVSTMDMSFFIHSFTIVATSTPFFYLILPYWDPNQNNNACDSPFIFYI